MMWEALNSSRKKIFWFSLFHFTLLTHIRLAGGKSCANVLLAFITQFHIDNSSNFHTRLETCHESEALGTEITAKSAESTETKKKEKLSGDEISAGAHYSATFSKLTTRERKYIKLSRPRSEKISEFSQRSLHRCEKRGKIRRKLFKLKTSSRRRNKMKQEEEGAEKNRESIDVTTSRRSKTTKQCL